MVERAVFLLHAGGCSGIIVVGAAAEEVTAIVTALSRDDDVVTCPDWDEGMGASLPAGLTVLTRSTARAKVASTPCSSPSSTLPDLTLEVVARVLDARATSTTTTHHTAPPTSTLSSCRTPPTPQPPTDQELRATLRRAAYDGLPGHPALIGRDHWEPVIASANGGHGARHYFRTTSHEIVDCGASRPAATSTPPKNSTRLPKGRFRNHCS